MTPEEQENVGLSLLKRMTDSADRLRESGNLRDAERDFFRAAGVLMALDCIGILSDEEAKELRDELYENHYVHA